MGLNFDNARRAVEAFRVRRLPLFVAYYRRALPCFPQGAGPSALCPLIRPPTTRLPASLPFPMTPPWNGFPLQVKELLDGGAIGEARTLTIVYHKAASQRDLAWARAAGLHRAGMGRRVDNGSDTGGGGTGRGARSEGLSGEKGGSEDRGVSEDRGGSEGQGRE